MQLPPELQSQICQTLTKAELKVVRLVCKSLDRAAVPFLFNEVFVAASYADLDIADLVTSRFGSYVKTITLSFVEYVTKSWEEFRGIVEREMTDKLERFNGHLEHAFEVYCKAQTENIEINGSSEFMARLCYILSRSPNIRKMILTDCGNNDNVYDVDQLDPRDPWKEDDLCPFKVCRLSVSRHVRFHVRPRSPYRMTPNPFHLAMLALSVTKSTITELAMIHVHDGDELGPKEAYLSEDAFVMTVQQSCCLTQQLQHLTKLRLGIANSKAKLKAQNHHHDHAVAKALSVAVKLETLFIETDNHNWRPDCLTTMSSCLQGCKFPKLRSLILRRMNSGVDELVEFLENSPCVRHLALEYFNLNVGLWEDVVQELRSALQLESVMLHGITRSNPSSNNNNELDCSNDHHLIEDFFLRNGENPFTEAATNRWRKMGYATRWGINEDLVGCETRYQMFH